MSVLWFGLVSWVGASHRVNLIALIPLGQDCPRKITTRMTMTATNWVVGQSSIVPLDASHSLNLKVVHEFEHVLTDIRVQASNKLGNPTTSCSLKILNITVMFLKTLLNKSLGTAPLHLKSEHCRLSISPSSSKGERHLEQLHSNM